MKHDNTKLLRGWFLSRVCLTRWGTPRVLLRGCSGPNLFGSASIYENWPFRVSGTSSALEWVMSQKVESRTAQTLLIEDAARALGVSRRTVYYRIREGRLRTIRTRGGSQRVLLCSIEALRCDARPAGAGPPVDGRRDEAVAPRSGQHPIQPPVKGGSPGQAARALASGPHSVRAG